MTEDSAQRPRSLSAHVCLSNHSQEFFYKVDIIQSKSDILLQHYINFKTIRLEVSQNNTNIMQINSIAEILAKVKVH